MDLYHAVVSHCMNLLGELAYTLQIIYTHPQIIYVYPQIIYVHPLAERGIAVYINQFGQSEC